MNGLITWWARNSVAANLMMLVIIVAGVITYNKLGREVFPSAKMNMVSVSVAWPGADPQQVEDQILLRIEEAVQDVDNLKDISATAGEGFANLTISMNEGANFTEFLTEIKNRVDGISTLPRDAFPPVVRRFNFNNDIIYVTIAGNLDERSMAKLGRRLRDEVAALPDGSPLVNLYGARREEVSIEVSEEALRRYGLTFGDVANAIRGSSINLSSGTVRTETGNIQLATRNLADNEEEFSRIVVRQNLDGSVVRVRDVATVIDGFVDDNAIDSLDGKKSLLIGVQQPENVNVVRMSKAVRDWLEERQETLPEGVTMSLWFDFSEAYTERMELVSSNALLGLAMVVVVLLLFLRLEVALWVAVGIAVSFIGSVIFMPMVGVTLNMLSLFGLLLVIGIVVDDALIVGESIHRQVERGRVGLDAATVGTQIVLKPVFFAVLTTMMMFLPWIFLSGGVSDFTKHITWTIIFALSFSLIESFFILPSHLAHMKPINRDNGFYRLQQKIADSLIWVAKSLYRPFISMAIKARYITATIFVMAFAISISLFQQGWIKFNFMPEVEGTFLSLTITPREGTPFSRNEQIYQIVTQASDELRADLEEEYGKELIESAWVSADDNNVQAWLTVIDGNYREISMEQIADRLREKIGDIPDAESITVNYTINSGNADLAFGIEGNDLDELRLASEEIKAYLRSVNGTYDVRDSLQSANEEIQVNLKPGAERFGITLAQAANQVRQAYYGEEVQRLPRDGDDVRVMVRYPKETRESLDSLQSFRIRTADGREIPLAAVVEITYAPSYSRINRFNRKLSTTITANLREGVESGPITKDFYNDFVPQFNQRHPNVQIENRGDNKAQAEFMQEFMILLLAALGGMYVLLAIGFNSYWQPILIMTAIIFALMGAIFGHLIVGIPFALFSIFGWTAAAGVAINDNLVLIDYVNRLRREGVGAFAALVEAGTTRFRPILLTSVTTFVGLMPILLEDSINAKFLSPMVVALAFGVFFALFVSLIFVPALYAIGVDIARFFRGLWTGEKQPAFSHGASESGVMVDIEALVAEQQGDDDEGRDSEPPQDYGVEKHEFIKRMPAKPLGK